MKAVISTIILVSLLNISSCSEDKIDNQTQKPKTKQSVPTHIETNPTPYATYSKNTQELQPDLHLSGSHSTHISGINSTSKHISGQ